MVNISTTGFRYSTIRITIMNINEQRLQEEAPFARFCF